MKKYRRDPTYQTLAVALMYIHGLCIFINILIATHRNLASQLILPQHAKLVLAKMNSIIRRLAIAINISPAVRDFKFTRSRVLLDRLRLLYFEAINIVQARRLLFSCK